jgi:hypothetical protein
MYGHTNYVLDKIHLLIATLLTCKIRLWYSEDDEIFETSGTDVARCTTHSIGSNIFPI